VSGSRTEEERKEKRESQLDRDIHQETTGQVTRLRKDRKTGTGSKTEGWREETRGREQGRGDESSIGAEG